MESDLVYDVRNVSYRDLGRFEALHEVTLSVAAGEKIALVGANGSGKSTLLFILGGLFHPCGGSVRFRGDELTERRFADATFNGSFRRRVGIVFQNSDVQLFTSRVEDELLFGLEQLGLPAGECADRARKYAGVMGVGHLLGRHPQNLSIGEKKRVAIASVLAMEPEVLILDEPTAGLDPKTSRHLIDAINEFSGRGATVITATQDIHLVPEVAERVVVMSADKTVVRTGGVDAVLADTPFLERHNLVHVHAHRHKDIVHVHEHEHGGHGHAHPELEK